MLGRRADRRRTNRRAFQPTLDGRLESRQLMAKVSAFHANPNPPGHPGEIRTVYGGQGVRLITRTGKAFEVITTSGSVSAYRMSNGRFGLTIGGTGVDSQVTINPVVGDKVKGSAHQPNPALGRASDLINIGAINVTSGSVNSILGYRDAILSGPLVATASTVVDRIAFDTLAPGASINVGGDLNTLDVLNNLTLSGGGTGIVVGRDLNSMSVGGNVTIANASVFYIGRFVGLIPQPAKGTAPAPQPIASINTDTNITIPIADAAINGNLVLPNGGQFIVNGALKGFFIVNGAVVGAANIHINGNGNFLLVNSGVS